MIYHHTAIRTVVERLKLKSVSQIAQRPGAQTVYRILVYYADGRTYHSASTLIDETLHRDKQLETIYSGFYQDRPFKQLIDNQRFQKFEIVLRTVKFDNLQYKGSDLLHTPTIWGIERATASFSHQLML